MVEIRDLGRMPKEIRNASREKNLLAYKIRRVKTNGEFSRAQIEEMAAFSSNAPQLAADEKTSTKVADEIMDSIHLFFRAFGRMPKESRSASEEENLLANTIRRLKKNGEFSDAQVGDTASVF